MAPLAQTATVSSSAGSVHVVDSSTGTWMTESASMCLPGGQFPAPHPHMSAQLLLVEHGRVCVKRSLEPASSVPKAQVCERTEQSSSGRMAGLKHGGARQEQAAGYAVLPHLCHCRAIKTCIDASQQRLQP